MHKQKTYFIICPIFPLLYFLTLTTAIIPLNLLKVRGYIHSLCIFVYILNLNLDSRAAQTVEFCIRVPRVIKHLTSLWKSWNVKRFSLHGSVKYHIIIVISLDLVSMSPGAGGVAWRRGGEATGAERRAAGAAQRAGGGAQRAGAAAQPGPPGTAGAGDPSGAAPTAGMCLRAGDTTPARGPLHCTGMDLRGEHMYVQHWFWHREQSEWITVTHTVLCIGLHHLTYAIFISKTLQCYATVRSISAALYTLIIPCTFWAFTTNPLFQFITIIV